MKEFEEEFSDGVNLCILLEVLSKQTIRYHQNPTNRAKRTENVALALEFIETKGGLQAYGWNASDIEVIFLLFSFFSLSFFLFIVLFLFPSLSPFFSLFLPLFHISLLFSDRQSGNLRVILDLINELCQKYQVNPIFGKG